MEKDECKHKWVLIDTEKKYDAYRRYTTITHKFFCEKCCKIKKVDEN